MIQTNFHRGETLHNTIRFIIQLNWKHKTKEFFNPPKDNYSATIIKVHYPVDGRHINFLCMFKLGCASTG